MFKLNEFGFPVFQFHDPKLAEEVTKTGQEILKQMSENQDWSWFFKATGNPFEPQYIEDKNLEKGDYVDFLDAEGCFFSKATICGVREDTALVQLDILPGKTTVVRKSDLLKLVPKKNF